MSLTRFSAGILLGVSAFFYGCDRWTPLPKSPVESAAPAPTRDDLYLFSFGRLSMTAYEGLRSAFPELSATDLARLAMAAQWLQAISPPEKGVSLLETTRCARLIFSPSPKPDFITAALPLLSQRIGIPSVDLLRHAHADASRRWVVTWNPNLRSEYRISAAP